MQRVRRLLEVGCGDANEQVIGLEGSSAASPLPVRRLPFCRPNSTSLLPAHTRRVGRSCSQQVQRNIGIDGNMPYITVTISRSGTGD